MPLHRLVIVRHGKAERAGVVPDSLRPLAVQGRLQAAALGTMLETAGWAPNVVLCSDALRTRQTWGLMANGLVLPPVLRILPSLYDARVADLLECVQHADESIETLLIVGHEPSVSATAAHYCAKDSDDASIAQVKVGVSPATACVLESDLEWAQWGKRNAKLVAVQRPG